MLEFPVEIHAPYQVSGDENFFQEKEEWEVSIRYCAERDLVTMSRKALDKDWKLNEFFGTIAVINLPESTKRLARTTSELNQIGVKNFTVFKAIHGRTQLKSSIWNKFRDNRAPHKINPSTEEGRKKLEILHQGEAGCYMSHYQLIKQVKEYFEEALRNLSIARSLNDEKEIKKAIENVKKYRSVLIFEDDVGFGFLNKNNVGEKKGIGMILREALLELPENWDILYFVVYPTGKTKKVSTNLIKLSTSYCLVAYAVNHTMYNSIVNHLKRIENPKVDRILPVDREIGFLQVKHNAYAIRPSICYHFAGISEISKDVKEKNWQH